MAVKKKLYATFKMAGFRVPIYLTDQENLDPNNLGYMETSGKGLAIYLSTALDKEFFQNVLFHEMLHAAAVASGISLSERQVEGITAMMRQAFQTFAYSKSSQKAMSKKKRARRKS